MNTSESKSKSNLSLKIATVFVFGLVATSQRTFAGLEEGPKNRPPMWFLNGSDKTEIDLCFEASPQILNGHSKAQLQVLIADAFGTWKTYIEERKLYEQTDAGPLLKLGKIETSCAGSESLRIYFGVDNKKTEDAKASYRQPLAFEVLESYKDGWGQGFIWIADQGSLAKDSHIKNFPNWNSGDQNLRGTLLHVLGHILGNSDTEGTIMSPEIRSLIASKEDSDKVRLVQIDHETELLFCITCDQTFHLYTGDDTFSVELANAFRLSGREPGKRASVRLERTISSDDSLLPQGTLIIEDEKGRDDFQVRATRLITKLGKVRRVFSMDAGELGGLSGETAFNASAREYMGEIILKDNKTIPLQWIEGAEISERLTLLSANSAGAPLFGAYSFY